MLPPRPWRSSKPRTARRPSSRCPTMLTEGRRDWSRGLDACFLDDGPPLFDLGLLEGEERLRRLLVARRNVEPLLCAARAHRWVSKGFDHGGVELGDDGVGRALGRPKAPPQ